MRPIAQRGFTLIELMITVVIIAILASIAVPSYQGYIKKTKIQEAQSNLVGLSLSAESNYQRQLSYYSGSLASATAIKTQFTTWNPTSDNFDYSYNSTDGATYTLTATGNKPPITGCVLTLTHTGAKTVSNCGSITQWVN